jgi:hypothetical protein
MSSATNPFLSYFLPLTDIASTHRTMFSRRTLLTKRPPVQIPHNYAPARLHPIVARRQFRKTLLVLLDAVGRSVIRWFKVLSFALLMGSGVI